MTYIDTTFIEKYTTNTNILRTEPENFVDKYAVCTLKVDEVVGHLKKGKDWSFRGLLFS